MNKIDVSNWKKFRVGDFFDVQYGKFIPRNQMVENNGFPHVTASAFNNGYSYYVKEPMFPAGCISVASDGSIGAVFYHNKPYSAGNIISNLIPHEDVPMTDNIGLFIASSLSKIAQNYSWDGFKFSVNRVRETLLSLPSTNRLVPDWNALTDLLEKGGGGIEMSKIDTSNWKEFSLGELFEIKRGTSRIMRNLTEGTIPLIAAARAEQGVAGYFNIEPEYENAITVSCNGAGCGSTFFHRGKFAITGDASVLLPKQQMTEEVLLFMASLCDKQFTQKYSYAEKCSPSALNKTLIKLPAKSIDVPDWEYMETYMKEVMEKEEIFAEHLSCLMGGVEGSSENVVDTSGWKEFRVGDLFVLDRGKESAPNRVPSGNIPLVNEISTNNGIARKAFSNNIFSGNSITISVNYAQNVFYQPKPYCASVNILILKCDILPQEVCLFIATILRKKHSIYNYTNKISKEKLLNEKIKLPVSSSGEPDWEYMKKYINQITNYLTNSFNKI